MASLKNLFRRKAAAAQPLQYFYDPVVCEPVGVVTRRAGVNINAPQRLIYNNGVFDPQAALEILQNGLPAVPHVSKQAEVMTIYRGLLNLPDPARYQDLAVALTNTVNDMRGKDQMSPVMHKKMIEQLEPLTASASVQAALDHNAKPTTARQAASKPGFLERCKMPTFGDMFAQLRTAFQPF